MTSCCAEKEPEKCARISPCTPDPSAPPAEQVHSDAPPPISVQRLVVDDSNQNATANHNPCYVNNGHLGNQETGEPSENDALMDEETMASTWTPATDTPDQSSPTTFENALQLQQLHITQPTSITVTTNTSTTTTNTTTDTTGSEHNTSHSSEISIMMPNNYSNSGNSAHPNFPHQNSTVHLNINLVTNPNVTQNFP